MSLPSNKAMVSSHFSRNHTLEMLFSLISISTRTLLEFWEKDLLSCKERSLTGVSILIMTRSVPGAVENISAKIARLQSTHGSKRRSQSPKRSLLSRRFKISSHTETLSQISIITGTLLIMTRVWILPTICLSPQVLTTWTTTLFL